MIVEQIAGLGILCLLMGGCSQFMTVPTAYSSLPAATAGAPAATAADISQAPLPSVVLPGQMREAALGRVGTGVDPNAVLRASADARAAWTPLKPADLALPTAAASGFAPARKTGDASDPLSTASVISSVGSDPARRVPKGSYDREAVMERLIRAGRKDASPICDGC